MANIKLNLSLFDETDITMWSPPEVITCIGDIETLLSEFGYVLSYQESNWDMNANNCIQLMKRTIDDIKIQLMMDSSYSKEDQKTVIKLINTKLKLYDVYITKSKQDWVELGYNPPMSTRRRGKRR